MKGRFILEEAAASHTGPWAREGPWGKLLSPVRQLSPQALGSGRVVPAGTGPVVIGSGLWELRHIEPSAGSPVSREPLALIQTKRHLTSSSL